MQVVCIAKPGVSLLQTLTDSETSRHILCFYRPEDIKYGVRVQVSAVSSALALLSELRWYLLRYTTAALIEDTEHGVYLTRELAGKVYVIIFKYLTFLQYPLLSHDLKIICCLLKCFSITSF